MNYYDYVRQEMMAPAMHHTHEFLGSTYISETGKEAHNHRFAGISSEAIPAPGGHVHEINTNTSFEDEHIHHIQTRTGIQMPVGNNKHIHLVEGITTRDDNHTHDYQLTTLI